MNCRSSPVAIVGMACLYPKAPDLDSYWENILGGVSAVGEPPPDWGAAWVYDPESDGNDRIYCKIGGFLHNEAWFNPLDSGVMPNAIDGAEPDQFLALRLARDALADAGYLERSFARERTAVIAGRGEYFNRGNVTALQHGMIVDQTLRVLEALHPEHTDSDLKEIKRQLKAVLPPFNAETAPGLVPNVVCGRIANRLDLMGPNYTIDAACASSLIALDLGCRELTTGRCDMVLVGGLHASTPPIIMMVFSQLNALSRRGQIRPFDAAADGTLLGEGLGFVVLKRLHEAERDGDRIYAVVRGVGTSSDGRALGLLAPRLEGEILAMRNAYRAANIAPETIGLIEAHGTGTPVGDSTEIEALLAVFSPRDAMSGRCAIGSVKSMIGHCMPGAGMAGLIKTAMALHHKVLPPSLNCDEPNAALGTADGPLYVNTRARPWINGAHATPRRAAVSAFGFGGINAHAVLEEWTGNQS
jgi:acyl transferase domain-containing protein